MTVQTLPAMSSTWVRTMVSLSMTASTSPESQRHWNTSRLGRAKPKMRGFGIARPMRRYVRKGRAPGRPFNRNLKHGSSKPRLSDASA